MRHYGSWVAGVVALWVTAAVVVGAQAKMKAEDLDRIMKKDGPAQQALVKAVIAENVAAAKTQAAALKAGLEESEKFWAANKRADALDINNPQHREISAFRLIAKLPTITAMAYKYSVGQPFVYPRNDLSYSANFMRMMFATPAEDYKVNEVLVRALDRILILHADHEQNASTSTVRLAGSSGANPFACIAAGIACLWGPAHGGANEAALNMLEDIQRNGGVEKIGECDVPRSPHVTGWQSKNGCGDFRCAPTRNTHNADASAARRSGDSVNGVV